MLFLIAWTPYALMKGHFRSKEGHELALHVVMLRNFEILWYTAVEYANGVHILCAVDRVVGTVRCMACYVDG